MNSGHVPETPLHPFRDTFIRTPLGILVSLVLAAVGLYLLLSHTGHVLAAAPYLILLGCPLMHLFMHGGTHKHGK